MKRSQTVTRRGFMQVTVAAAGAALSPAVRTQTNEPAARRPFTVETEHFWYREQAPGKYIDCQRGNQAFAYAEGKVFLSRDNMARRSK